MNRHVIQGGSLIIKEKCYKFLKTSGRNQSFAVVSCSCKIQFLKQHFL